MNVLLDRGRSFRDLYNIFDMTRRLHFIVYDIRSWAAHVLKENIEQSSVVSSPQYPTLLTDTILLNSRTWMLPRCTTSPSERQSWILTLYEILSEWKQLDIGAVFRDMHCWYLDNQQRELNNFPTIKSSIKINWFRLKIRDPYCRREGYGRLHRLKFDTSI